MAIKLIKAVYTTITRRCACQVSKVSCVAKRFYRHYALALLATSIVLLTLGTWRSGPGAFTPLGAGRPDHVAIGGKKLFQEGSYQYGDADSVAGDATTRACPILPEDLGLVGQIPVNVTAPTWAELTHMYPEVELGGRWRPRDCVATSRVAIVLPYRDRDYNLRAFLQHMHSFLQRQKLDYGIIVAEQAGNSTFNRGLMRNIGFKEANLYGQYDCTVFNDVDLLPENDHNSYGCSDVPRHMCIALNYFNYKPVTNGAIFGGALSFRNDHFRRVNGYSNLYFGWGGEDDDLMTRVKRTGVGFYRARPQYGRYTGTPHTKDHRIRSTYKLWRYREGRAEADGLNSLRYTVLKTERRPLYTWVMASIDEETYKADAQKYLDYMDELSKNKTVQHKSTNNTKSQQNESPIKKGPHR